MSSKMGVLVAVSVVGLAITASAAPARADEPPMTPTSGAHIREAAREYYDAETKASWLFVGYGAVTAGVGGVALTQSGDFAKGFGWSSVIGGGLTAVGGIGYLLAVKLRGDYYQGLAATDLAAFQREEAEHVGGTHRHFFLYLGYEIVETLAGAGIASYGLAAKKDLWKGIGSGVALQGIGLLVIDVPGAGRAAKYDDEVRRFNPSVALSLGGDGRPWGATVSQRF